MAYNNPKWLIIPALMAVATCGFTQPFFGWIFSKLMQVMTLPVSYMKKLHGDRWDDVLKDEVTTLTLYTCGIALAMFVGYIGKSYIFSYLGENVTMKVRQELYKSILMKHMGFFDFQENQSSVLTSAMAQDTALINGAASESLGPYTESFFALGGGLAIGFYFCW